MVSKIINGNGKKSKFEFDLANIDQAGWDRFVKHVIAGYANDLKIKNTCYSVSIRSNIAKVQISWEDSKFHDVNLKLDTFGEVNNYKSVISGHFRSVMSSLYGESYDQESNAVVHEVKHSL